MLSKIERVKTLSRTLAAKFPRIERTDDLETEHDLNRVLGGRLYEILDELDYLNGDKYNGQERLKEAPFELIEYRQIPDSPLPSYDYMSDEYVERAPAKKKKYVQLMQSLMITPDAKLKPSRSFKKDLTRRRLRGNKKSYRAKEY